MHSFCSNQCKKKNLSERHPFSKNGTQICQQSGLGLHTSNIGMGNDAHKMKTAEAILNHITYMISHLLGNHHRKTCCHNDGRISLQFLIHHWVSMGAARPRIPGFTPLPLPIRGRFMVQGGGLLVHVRHEWALATKSKDTPQASHFCLISSHGCLQINHRHRH